MYSIPSPNTQKRAVALMEEPGEVVLPLLPLHLANLGDSGERRRDWEMGEHFRGKMWPQAMGRSHDQP